MVVLCARCHRLLGNPRYWYEGSYYHPACIPPTNVAAPQARIAALEAQLAVRTGGVKGALEKLAALAERQKAYHNAKQHEFPSIEQCVDEEGVFRPDRNLYALLQGEAANGRYSEADWWLCTIRAEISRLSALEPAPEAQQEPVAWMDDGTIRAGSEQTAHRVVTDEQKRDMPSAVRSSFNVPLYTRPAEQAVTEELVAKVFHSFLKKWGFPIAEDFIRDVLKAAMEAGR